jgi:hypothetical protein
MNRFLILVLIAATACRSTHLAFDARTQTSATLLLQTGIELAETGSRHSHSHLTRGYPFYHHTDEIHQEATRLAQNCQGMASIRTLRIGNVAIDAVRVRANQTTPPANRVFILFGEHSRELISAESGLHFLRVLCGDATLPEGAPEPATVLRNTEFELLLNGNPLSRKRVEAGHSCVRMNPNGVDLNRNWDIEWGQHGAHHFGPYPFSEPETQIMKQLIVEFAPTTFLSVHSGTIGMYMPWGTDGHMAQRNQQEMFQLLMNVSDARCQCPVGAGGREVGYLFSGSSLDWVWANTNTSFSFTWEIYRGFGSYYIQQEWQKRRHEGGPALMEAGDEIFQDFFQQDTSDFVDHANSSRTNIAQSQPYWLPGGLDCLHFFNPMTEEAYREVVENWSAAYLNMATRAATILSSPELLDKP